MSKKKRMYTVELTYSVLYSATAIVMATSPEQACAEALSEPPHDAFKPGLEGDGPVFVENLCEGAHGSVHARPVGAPLLAVPDGYGEPHPAPQLRDLAARLAEYAARFADLNGEPEGGDCRALIATARELTEQGGER